MPRKNSKPIDIMQYRKVVLDKGTFEKSLLTPGTWVRANPDTWEPVKQNVQIHMGNYWPGYSIRGEGEQRPWKWIAKYGNHPLIENGMAFWIDDKTLVTGYNLKSNTDIYRPIFQHEKEKLNHELRMEIQKFAKFYAAEKRQKLYKKTLLGIPKLNILPEEIIHKIAHFTYDSLWYLKL
jgi:hypothetical protein